MTPTKIDLNSQLERKNFLTISGSDPQLIVYGDRVTLTASQATTGLFPNGYLFKSYPEEARPKQGDKVIALAESDTIHSLNIFRYIDETGPFIISFEQIPSDTAIFSNQTYQMQNEQSKYANFDTNSDGKIDIIDAWNINENGIFDSQTNPADGKSMAFPATVIRNAGARWTLIGMIYFVIKVQQKHLVFCLPQFKDEISYD
ncbi:MAG: hypothetical protein EZS28_024875 [Streblomastix strix]|uniref:Uncharacterized protein n=1 Tax=Streblomastix strix TaxID=222440 RepID=A0A5J4VAH2_9EUKA|nr:MAG: hypothetical protein EZS28_024875 [Streblomastix strix]